ncbi:hypothetical protein [Neisseria polysaccharea]|nr:hypothetical protein [Neisseria polysaccharea]
MPSETLSDRFRRHFPVPPLPLQTAFSVRLCRCRAVEWAVGWA